MVRWRLGWTSGEESGDLLLLILSRQELAGTFTFRSSRSAIRARRRQEVVSMPVSLPPKTEVTVSYSLFVCVYFVCLYLFHLPGDYFDPQGSSEDAFHCYIQYWGQGVVGVVTTL